MYNVIQFLIIFFFLEKKNTLHSGQPWKSEIEIRSHDFSFISFLPLTFLLEHILLLIFKMERKILCSHLKWIKHDNSMNYMHFFVRLLYFNKEVFPPPLFESSHMLGACTRGLAHPGHGPWLHLGREPRPFCVWSRRDNHYTWSHPLKSHLLKSFF